MTARPTSCGRAPRPGSSCPSTPSAVRMVTRPRTSPSPRDHLGRVLARARAQSRPGTTGPKPLNSPCRTSRRACRGTTREGRVEGVASLDRAQKQQWEDVMNATLASASPTTSTAGPTTSTAQERGDRPPPATGSPQCARQPDRRRARCPASHHDPRPRSARHRPASARRWRADVSDQMHGVATTYKNHGCRCAPCTAAAVRYSEAAGHQTATVGGAGRATQPMRIPIDPSSTTSGPASTPAGATRELAREAGISTSRLSRIL